MLYRILSGLLAALWIGFGVGAFFWYGDSGIYRSVIVPLALVTTGVYFLIYALTGRASLHGRKD
jgi:hypothetical protein